MKVLEFVYKYLNIIKNAVLNFIKNSFTFTATKSSKIVGLIIGAVTLLTVIIFTNQFTLQEFSQKWLLLAFALICPFILGISAA